MKRSHIALLAGLVVAGIAIAFLPSLFSPSAIPGARSVEVGVVTLSRQQVAYTAELPGRVQASEVAEIRPRVNGIIESINFVEGSTVEQGGLLYQIQPDSYEAALAVVQASLRRAEAGVPAAQATVERYEQLAEGGGVSESELENARVTLLQAEADVASAQASVTEAQLNLDLTRITAPISGVIGLSNVSQGALVTANQTDPLATVRQLDPVRINLVDSSANLLALRARIAAGLETGAAGAPGEVHLTLEDDSQYGETGTVSLADIVVSETAGTITIRATIANPDRVLMPGMFVRATVSLGVEDAFLVPQRAVTRDGEGNATAFFVSDEGIAESRTLETVRSYDNAWVVTGGVEEGDRLIVDGLQTVSDGTEVTAIDVEIDEDGVILQTIGEPTASDATGEQEAAPAAAPEGAPQ